MQLPLTATQYPGEKKQTATVVMGIDFGTSSTKVVIQSPTLGYSYAIQFEEFGHSTNKFLLPTRPYFNKNGELKLDGLGQDIPLRELKRSLMHPEEVEFKFNTGIEFETDSNVLIIGYLAKVIQLSRNWFLKTYNETYETYSLEWVLNIGMPSTGNEYEEKREFFKNIICNSWNISVLYENIVLAEIVTYLNNIKVDCEPQNISFDNIDAFPEIVAESAGYARSNLRMPGLHLMIDVGAGTLDISSFRLFEDHGVSSYAIFTGDVEWLGGFELHKSRINRIKPKINDWLTILGMNEDPVSPIFQEIEEYMPNSKILQYSTKEMDEDFFQSSFEFIQKTISCLLKDKDPNATEWRTGLRAFLCGGGKDIKFYTDVINEINSIWRKQNLAGLNIFYLNKPEGLFADGIDDNNFNRIAVAYGLSFRLTDIGTIKPPEEISNVPKPEPPEDYTEHFISHDT